jgi:hypothetical protein
MWSVPNSAACARPRLGASCAPSRLQAMKRVETLLENKSNGKYRSRYAMVCYGGDGNVGYANAKALGPVTQEILEELCQHMVDGAGGNIATEETLQAQVDKVDWVLATKLVEEKLVPKIKELQMDLSTVKH